ncbi:MAG: hypothetical protein ACM34G_04435 [Acidobacteriota bacterium]
MSSRSLLSLAFCGFAVLAFGALPALAQRGEGPLNPAQPQGITVDQIIQRFAAKEKMFQEARESYTYRQSVKVMTVDGDTVTGEYQEIFDVLFDNNGNRIEQVKYAPQSTLENGGISMTEQDLNDIRHLMPFVLTTEEISEYDIIYRGSQQEDELHCYVFDIAPKKIEKNKRYFQGRIWVDDHDLQIVKTYGKSVPDIRKKNQENLFPKFTTWRQQIDGVYWFPVYTRADDVLHFSIGDVHIREIVNYEDYKRFGSKVKITYQGEELPGQGKPGAQQGQPQQPAPGQGQPAPPQQQPPAKPQ